MTDKQHGGGQSPLRESRNGGPADEGMEDPRGRVADGVNRGAQELRARATFKLIHHSPSSHASNASRRGSRGRPSDDHGYVPARPHTPATNRRSQPYGVVSDRRTHGEGQHLLPW